MIAHKKLTICKLDTIQNVGIISNPFYQPFTDFRETSSRQVLRGFLLEKNRKHY